MKKHQIKTIIPTLLLFFCSTLFADSNKEVDALKKELESLIERIDELEDSVGDVTEKTGNRAIVQAYDGIKLDIGGFLHTAYTYVDGEDNSEGSFNRQNFELLLGAELTESWTAFVAAGYLRESDDPFVVSGDRRDPQFNTNNRNPLIIGWVNYAYNDQVNIRAGRIITPHGIINIEHFPATLLEPEQPQFLRPFGGNTLFPNFSTGVQFHGKKFTGKNILSYTSYATNATGSDDANDELIVGGRVALGNSAGNWDIGLNYSDSYRQSTDSDNELVGIDLRLRYQSFEMKAEYYTTDEDSGGDREAYYIQPIWHASNKWSLFYRYDFLDAGDVLGESTENVFGVNYLPNKNVRLRLTYTLKEFDEGFTDSTLTTSLLDADADIIQVSGTFSF